jgi:hypothetical protein
MSQQTLPNQELGGLMNDKFISVKVQMDRIPSDNETVKARYADAKLIEESYEVHAYPTVLFLSPDGKLINRVVGFLNPENMIQEAKKAISLMGNYGAKIVRFNEGKLDTAAMRTLITEAQGIRDWPTVTRVTEAYAKRLNKKDFLKKHNLVFIGGAMSSKNKYFNLFLKKADEINKIVFQNYAEEQVMRVIYEEEIRPYDKAEKPDWDAIEKKVVAKYGSLGEERVWGNRMAYNNSVKDWKDFAKYYKLYFDRAIPHERSFIHINNLSWPVFEHVMDSAVLKTAIKTMEYDLDKFQRYDETNAVAVFRRLGWLMSHFQTSATVFNHQPSKTISCCCR